MKKVKYFKLQYLILLLLPYSSMAQDFGFTQTMQTPMFYNPAFAGFQENPRIGLQFRLQPLVGGAFVNLAASGDIGFQKLNSGVGIMFNTSSDGTLTTTSASICYAYQIKFTNTSFLRLGINGGFYQKSYILSQAPDSNSANNNTPSIAEATPLVPDFAVGALYYTDNYYLGAAVYHLFEPGYANVGDPYSKTSRRYDIQIGKFYNSSNIIINPYLLVLYEDPFWQVLPGINATFGRFTIGTSFRAQGNPAQDNLNFLFGVEIKKFKICYSYDISLLSTGITEGIHELTFVLQFDQPNNTSDNQMISRMRGAY